MGWLRKIRRHMPQEIPGPIAALYEKVATGALCGFYRQVASRVTSSITCGRVLDVGTGPGYLPVEIVRRNPDLEVVGVDLSRKMLKIAQSVARREANTPMHGGSADRPPRVAPVVAGSRVQLVRGDVNNLPFPDSVFDLVISTLSLHHWRDPARGIQECLRVTVPGGQCWIYDLRTDAPAGKHAELLKAKGLRGFILGWIFKFHGVDSKDYAAPLVARWMDNTAKVRVELHPAYLKLNIRKAHCEQQERSSYCCVDSHHNGDSVALSASSLVRST